MSSVKISAQELRQKYLKFFQSKGHTVIPSASLVPENDPTTLFTTAGMHPLVPYIMGEKHPGGKRVTNVQKCIRTTDIDEVGDATHHTFFEMMGNWSFGDYFKKESIEMSWEFLTSPEWLGLDKNKLAVSVFEGDDDASFDEESFEKWKKLGMPEERIARLPKKNNWWGPAGETGPCGPDTEIFYWVGEADNVPESFADDNDQWVEIWNNVFMEYEKTKEDKFIPLAQKNVDTGMGLERILAVMNGFDDNYKTGLFWPIIEKIKEISGKKYDEHKKEFRIIADHIKAATFVISEGIAPSNTDQGYVVRRLIRRAIRYGRMIGIENSFVKDVAEVVLEIYGNIYSELDKNKEKVFVESEKEENKFNKTLERGLRELKYLATGMRRSGSFSLDDWKDIHDIKNRINGQELFRLFSTYGFPLEMSFEELDRFREKNPNEFSQYDKKKVIKEFNEELKKHQELSRTASAGKFKGGLADSGEETKKLHTAAHLMLAALRKVLGEHVHQKGSNITAERLRFDFSHPEKMTEEQKDEVEKLVNEVIEKKMPIVCQEMSLEQAREKGVEGVFENKYGEKVKVYAVGDGDDIFSREICGGPHAENTGELGKFKIKKEESSGAGVRRIKAVLE